MDSWKGTSKSALAILRVSSFRQDDNTSKEVQRAEIERYCASQGLDLIRAEEITESAKDADDRRKYRALIDWALKERIRHVIFYMFDREARNLTDVEANEKLVRQDKIVLHYVRDHVVLHKNSSDNDFLMRNFQAVQNHHYSRTLRTKVIDSMRHKAESGWFPSNTLPLGYMPQATLNAEGKERKRGKIVAPDPRTMNQVLREFQLRAEGLSFEAIRLQIIQEGFIPASKVRNYSTTGIEERIKNPFYRGYFTWMGVEYKGKHELFIPQSLLEQVDQTINKRGFSKKEVGVENIFSGGWLKCSCGCYIVYDPKTKTNPHTGETRTYPYYHCTDGKRVHKTLKGRNVSESSLWEQFGDAVSAIVITPEIAKDIADAMNDGHRRAQATTKQQMANYREAMSALDVEDDKLYEDLRKGILDEELFKRQRQKVKAQRQEFGILLEQATLAVTDSFMETVQSTLELATCAKAHWNRGSAIERRNLLNRILSNPILDGTTVRFDWKKPFNVLAEIEEKLEWRTRQGSNLGPSDP